MAEITLEFLASQQQNLLEETHSLKDDMAVMLAIVQRLDGSFQGLLNEVRAEHARYSRLDARLRELAEHKDDFLAGPDANLYGRRSCATSNA